MTHPLMGLLKATKDVYYLPIHTVRKEFTMTMKLRVVFDVSTKSESGVLLNDGLLVGPTINASLIDVLLVERQ